MDALKSLLLLPAVLLVSPATAAQEQAPIESANCIDLSRLRDTEIVDSQNVIFTMSDGTHYLNTLPHMCAGLTSSDSLLFRSTANQLCNVDTISTMQKLGGGFNAGPACGLGEFVAIGESEIDILRLRNR